MVFPPAGHWEIENLFPVKFFVKEWIVLFFFRSLEKVAFLSLNIFRIDCF